MDGEPRIGGDSIDRILGRLRGGIDAFREDLPRFVAFHGRMRLVGVGSALLGLALAGWWLLRPPAPPVETLIPRATAAGSTLAGSTDSGSGGGSQSVTTVIRVHVAGAVRDPGVYALAADARVIDAVRAAGGATSSADLERINLAQSIVDAEQIFVPRRGSVRTATTVAPRHRPRRSSPTTTSSAGAQDGVPAASSPPVVVPAPVAPTTRVNLNTATVEQLDALPGVGPATARAIVSYRTRRGPFAKVEDLLNIDGIGPKKLESIKAHVET